MANPQQPPAGEQAKPPIVPLEEAISNVDLLGELPTPDPHPMIEAKTIALTYHANFDTNFSDRTAFITGIARYMEEATVHSEMNKLLKQGEEHAVMLYTWRSCARAVPSIKSNLQENRREIKETFVEIMKPEIAKLSAFMHFQDKAIQEFCDDFKRLCHIEKRNDFVSESYLLTLGRLMNMFAVLDALKDSKASVRNDNSAYNRDMNFLRAGIDVNAVQEASRMTMFLATNQSITNVLKGTLVKIDGYEEFIADIVNLCVRLFDSQQYLMPAEKHLLVKVMGIGLFLMDNENNSIYKMDQKNRINLSKIDKIFKQLEVVPLYGDLQISVLSYIKRCGDYENRQSFWKSENITATGSQFNLLRQQNTLRDEHTRYLARLIRCSKAHAPPGATESNGPPAKRSDEENKAIYELALSGLRLLSKLTALVTEMFSWKLLHPSTSHRPEVEKAEEYEKATRFNYNKEEKFALIEIIAMIKSLQALMSRTEPLFQDAIHRSIYAEIQDFVQLTLREPMRAAVKRTKKKKGSMILSIIRGVRESCCDWLEGNSPDDDPVLKGEKDPKAGYQPKKVPRKAIAPSTTQLYMVRTMLESLVADKGGTGKKTLRQELQGLVPVEPLEEFIKKSFFYLHMINLPDTIRKCGDLSQLWYREFYLEMTMGNHIQFPIEMSIPWILTDEILTAKEPALMEYVFFPLDLYNDSAQYALAIFKKQFLYDEIEAEVNLCFDQLVYKLTEMIFAYYKELAGSMLLDKRFRKECKRFNIDIPCQQANKYDTILRQKHVQILGRSVDMSRLLSQRLVQSFIRSLKLAISRFECHGLQEGIIELDCLIQICQLAYMMLSKYLTLPAFSALMQEADSSVGGPCGTIALTVALELSSEILPKFCYNGTTKRFVRTKLMFEEAPKEKPANAQPAYYFGSKVLNTVYGQIAGIYKGFMGIEHIRIMVRHLGYQQLHVVIEELLKIVKGWIQSMCLPYVKVLLEKAMLPKCKRPRAEYGTEGFVVYYYNHVQDVVQYSDLKTHCLCAFQSVGNAIIFFHLLDQVLNVEEAWDLFQASPFLNILPRPYCAKGEKLETKVKQMEQNYAALYLCPLMQRLGTREQLRNMQENDLLLRERGACGSIIFKEILGRVRSFLDDPIWTGAGQTPENGIMHLDEGNVEFHRLWSAIMIVCCLPLNPNNISVEESYGDGLNWAGCAIMTLLGQVRRFELLDLASDILRVNEIDGKNADVNGISVKRYMDRISKYQILNQQIFEVLDKALGMGQEKEQGGLGGPAVEEVKLFQPPLHQSQVKSL